MRLAVTSALIATSFLYASQTTAASFSPDQVKDIQVVIKEYLMSNPELIENAITVLQKRKQDALDQKRKTAIAENKDLLMNDPTDFFLGNPQGKKIMVAFLDPFCGHCRAFHPTMEEAVKANPNLKIIVKNIPILGTPSVIAVRAMLAAKEQNLYQPVMELILKEDPQTLLEDFPKAFGVIKGLDLEKLKKDLGSPAVEAYLNKMQNEAEKIQLEATPTLIIGDTVVEGGLPLEELQKLLSQTNPASDKGRALAEKK
ncbi:MAG: thioredoxin domain-containing protein [Alphaproteobacteria bacterium]|jgi:protein-disulfide isomerase|nr:thioredoxin domain-containing protein [Alphaproteobacteria bacterium]